MACFPSDCKCFTNDFIKLISVVFENYFRRWTQKEKKKREKGV